VQLFAALNCLCILEQHFGGTLGDHDGGSIGIAGRNRGHDRGIRYPQSIDPVDAQTRIHHRTVISTQAHRACAHRVKNGGSDAGRGKHEFFVGLQRKPGQPFFGLIAGQRRRRNDTANQANRIDGNAPVGIGAEISRSDNRRQIDLSAGDVYRSARCGPKISDACRECIEGVQRLSERVQR
jgi:hypothetical protein